MYKVDFSKYLIIIFFIPSKFNANFCKFNKHNRILKVYPVNPLEPPSAKAVGDFASEYIPYQCRLEIRKFPMKLESANGHSNGINHSF